MLGCDFFTVDTVLLRRLDALFFIELDTRRVYVAGVTANPAGVWVVQQARNLTMVFADRARPVRFMVRDRDDEVLRYEQIRVIRTPVRSPRANAFAERLVGTVRRECLDRMLIFHRHQLEAVLAEYVDHYSRHRPTSVPRPGVTAVGVCAGRNDVASPMSHYCEDPTDSAVSFTSTNWLREAYG